MNAEDIFLESVLPSSVRIRLRAISSETLLGHTQPSGTDFSLCGFDFQSAQKKAQLEACATR
jgi:hypothetical protein